MSYAEYLLKTGLKDCRRSWIEWKIDIARMTEKQAVKASYDNDFGYSKIN